jgi:hypothetical protein
VHVFLLPGQAEIVVQGEQAGYLALETAYLSDTVE